MRRHTFSILATCAALFSSAIAAEKPSGPVDVMMISLHEAVWTKLLFDDPPASLFTLALYHDPANRSVVSLPAKIQRRLLAVKGVRPDLFVPIESLSVPDNTFPKDGGAFPGVTKKGTDQNVDVYTASSFQWRGGEDLFVGWSRSSGPLAGHGGISIFRFDGKGWKFVKHHELFQY
jgi:hypothetical protein